MPAVRPDCPIHRMRKPAPIPSAGEDESLRRGQAARRQRAPRGSRHQRVLRALLHLVQRGGATRQEHDAGEHQQARRARGRSGPSGAVSMKPAAAETSTSRTMPNFDSSA